MYQVIWTDVYARLADMESKNETKFK
jgi:hypothetical protein